jgi:plasmid stability protein
MSEKITVDLDEATLKALSRQAATHGRSVAEETADILRRDFAASVDGDLFLQRAREAVRGEARAPFDREAFLRRARELAGRSRGLRLKDVNGSRSGDR